MRKTKRITVCGLIAALCLVIMLLGSFLGIGTYVSPMVAGVLLIPVGREFGRKYHLLLFAAVALLSLMLVTDVEQKLVFLCLLGWYPILRPRLQRLTRLPRLAVKLALFNGIMIALESLIMLVLVPEAESGWMIALLLILGNVCFLLYDRLIPVFELIYFLRLRKYLKLD